MNLSVLVETIFAMGVRPSHLRGLGSPTRAKTPPTDRPTDTGDDSPTPGSHVGQAV
jgi:hypothetical protein